MLDTTQIPVEISIQELLNAQSVETRADREESVHRFFFRAFLNVLGLIQRHGHL